jgi:hypothetical protein
MRLVVHQLSLLRSLLPRQEGVQIGGGGSRLGEEEADWGRRKQIGGGGRGLGSGGKKEKGEGGETEGRWERKREDHFEELPRLLLGLA